MKVFEVPHFEVGPAFTTWVISQTWPEDELTMVSETLNQNRYCLVTKNDVQFSFPRL